MSQQYGGQGYGGQGYGQAPYGTNPHYPQPPNQPQHWSQGGPQPGYGQPNNIVIMNQGATDNLSPEERRRMNSCKTAAMCCSISSLVMTCCCWFSIPAIVLGCREPAPGAIGSYKISIILSSVAFFLTIGWVVAVTIYIVVVVNAVTSAYNDAVSSSYSSYSSSYSSYYG